MVRIELRNMDTGEVSTFVGDDALIVMRDGGEITMAATGGDVEDAKELACLSRDFFDAQENACEQTVKRGPRGAVTALH